MKRTIFVSLFLVFILSLSFSFNKEIKYQNIDWNTPVSEIRTKLEAVNLKSSSEGRTKSNEWIISWSKNKNTNYQSIAGHKLSSWTATFYPTDLALMSTTGLIDSKYFKFYKIAFSFYFECELGKTQENYKTANAIFEDLLNKLNRIYGQASSGGNPTTMSSRYANWYGTNNSSIQLSLNVGRFLEDPKVTLTYLGDETPKKEAYEKQKESERTFDPSNTTGL